MRRRLRREPGDEGAAAVEFALVLPLVLLLVFGMINYGVVFSQQLTLNNAVREGARKAVVNDPFVGATTNPRTCDGILASVKNQLSGLALNNSAVQVKVTQDGVVEQQLVRFDLPGRVVRVLRRRPAVPRVVRHGDEHGAIDHRRDAVQLVAPGLVPALPPEPDLEVQGGVPMRVQLLSAGPRRDDEGAVAIVIALTITLFALLTAFAVDIGNAYSQRRQLSVAADAAALGAASAVGNVIPPGSDCTPSMLAALVDSSGRVGATAIATAVANEINSANTKSGQSEPASSVSVACVKTDPSDAAPNAVEVTVGNEREISTVFAGVVGIDKISTGSSAVAHHIRSRSAGGLRPWAVCNDTVTEAQSNTSTTFWTGIDKTPSGAGPCQTSASGNWGSVDFDGGSNPAGDLISWTMNGYPGPVTIPDPDLPADPGVTNSVTTALHSMVGQVVLFPVVTGFDGGGGNNASFNAVGIVTAKVCGVVYQNNTYINDLSGNSSGCWVTPTPPTSNVTTTTETANGGTIARNSKVLTTTEAKFTAAMAGDPNVKVTVPGAGNGGSDLVTGIASYTSPTRVTLEDDARRAVNSPGVTVTITTSTTITTGGFGPYDDRGNLLNHIQFRWINYSTSSYAGSASEPCDFSNRLCVGTTLLWR